MSGFERPRKRSSNEDGDKYDVPCYEAKFY